MQMEGISSMPATWCEATLIIRLWKLALNPSAKEHQADSHGSQIPTNTSVICSGVCSCGRWIWREMRIFCRASCACEMVAKQLESTYLLSINHTLKNRFFHFSGTFSTHKSVMIFPFPTCGGGWTKIHHPTSSCAFNLGNDSETLG